MKFLPESFEIYNIRTALLLYVLAPFLLIMLFAGWYSLYRLEAQVESRMQEDIELIARAIRLPLSYALEHGHSGSLKQTLSSAFKFDRVYGVYVYDETGRRIAVSGSHSALIRTEKAAGLALQGDRQGKFDEVGGEEVFSYFVPLTDSGGRINGLLQVTRRGSDFAQYIGGVRMRTLGMLAVFALLLCGLVYFGYDRAVGRHMKNIHHGMRKVAQGDLQHRVSPQGPSEILFLAQGINAMLDSIVQSEKEIAQRREKESELKTRLHQSEKLAAIGRFAAGVAHELGTPLSVADGKAQQSLRKTSSDAATLTEIRMELQRMERIIRQLMDFARPVALEFRAVAADTLARAALTQVEEECRKNAVTITVDGAVPAPVLHGDRLRLEQALVNLMRNAMQASPGGRVLLGWSSDNDGAIRFTVEDNGPGIDDNVREHLFEPFFTTKSADQGTGLGLAVVETVMNEHGGRVNIGRSALGGAKFCLCFPADVTTSLPADECKTSRSQ